MAFVHVQEASNSQGGSNTLTVTLNGTVSGNLITIINSMDAGIDISSIDVGGQTASLHTLSTGSADSLRIGDVILTSGGNKTITITYTGTPAGSGAVAAEWSGGASSNIFDVGSPNTSGNSTTPTVSITTTSDNDLLVGVASSAVSDPAAGSGFTLMPMPNANNFESGEYKLDAGTAGAKTVDFTTSSGAWTIAAASYKIAGAGAAGVDPGIHFAGPIVGNMR